MQNEMTPVNETNAYRCADNWRVEMEAEPKTLYGLEHNTQEARALADWLTQEKGIKVVAIRNNPDRVRAAKALGKEPLRFRYRHQAFTEMGLC